MREGAAGMEWWVLPWVAFTAGVAVLACLLLLLDHRVETTDRREPSDRPEEGEAAMRAGTCVGRRAGIVTVIGLASAGAVLGLAKLLQVDVVESAEEFPDEDW